MQNNNEGIKFIF